MTSPHTDTTGSVRAAREIDDICDQFETELKRGSVPRIEDHLGALTGVSRARLLEELLILDVHWRKRNGEQPGPNDYQTRFPELLHTALEEIINRGLGVVFQRGSTPGNDSTVAHESGDNRRIAPPRLRYFGDYELLDQIARGGMGVVYKARQISLNRLVAVKMILSGQFASEAQVKRFYSEAESAAQLDHPNIVSIYEVGEHDGDHYFSMALVEGTSLAAKLAEGSMEPRRAAELVSQVAQAIEYAHSKGVIHRDLKPSNVLLDANDRPRVTDFGLAKRVSDAEGLTMAGDILGTPSYMPPEQAAGTIDAVGPQADVYSLGAVLYALVSGRPPFQAASRDATLRQVVDQEPVRLRQLNSAIPRDLETITQKCLEKSVARRYASAAALAHDLENYLAGRPILARPTSTIERTWRLCRRNPMVSALSSLAFLLLCSIAAISVVAYLREAKSRGDLEIKSTALANSLASESKLRGDAEAQADTELKLRLAAEQQNRNLNALRLTADARRVFPEAPQQALLLAAEALEQNLRVGELPQIASEEALIELLGNYQPRPFELPRECATQNWQYSADGRWMISYEDQQLLLWDRRQIAPGYLPLRIPLQAECWSWQFAGSGSWLVGRERNELQLQLVSLNNPFVVNRVTVPQPIRFDVDISPDGRWYACIDIHDNLYLVDLSNPASPAKQYAINDGRETKFGFTPNSNWLIAFADRVYGTGPGYDSGTGARVFRISLTNPELPMQVCLSEDKEVIGRPSPKIEYRLSNDCRWLIWKSEIYDMSGDLPKLIPDPSVKRSPAPHDDANPRVFPVIRWTAYTGARFFSKDSRYVWATDHEKIYLYDLLAATRKPILETDDRRTDGRDFVTRIGDGFAVAGNGRKARFVRLPPTTDSPETMFVPDEWEHVSDAVATVNGQYLVTLNKRGLVRKWELDPVSPATATLGGQAIAGPLPETKTARLALEQQCPIAAGGILFGLAADGEWVMIRRPPERDQLLHIGAKPTSPKKRRSITGEIGHELGQGYSQLVLSGNDRWLVLMDKDWVWDLQGAGVRSPPHALKFPPRQEAGYISRQQRPLTVFSRTSQWLAVTGYHGQLRLNRCEGPPAEWSDYVLPNDKEITSVTFSTDEKFLATGTAETLALRYSADYKPIGFKPPSGTIRIHDLASPSTVLHTHTMERAISTLTFSPNGKQLLSISTTDSNMAVHLWRLDQKSPWKDPKSIEFQSQFSSYRRHALFSNDGRKILIASDMEVRLFDTDSFPENPRALIPIGKDGIVGAVFTPDNNFVAVTTRYGTPTIWDLREPKLRAVSLPGIGGDYEYGASPQIVGSKLTAEGKRLVALQSDGTLKLWNLSALGVDQLPMRIVHSNPIVSFALHSQRQELVLFDSAGELHSLNLDPHRLVVQAQVAAGRELNDNERKGFSCPAPSTSPTVRLKKTPVLPKTIADLLPPDLIGPHPTADPRFFTRRFDLNRDFDQVGEGQLPGASASGLHLLGFSSGRDSFATVRMREAADPAIAVKNDGVQTGYAGGVGPAASPPGMHLPHIAIKDLDAPQQLAGGDFGRWFLNPLYYEDTHIREGRLTLAFRAKPLHRIDVELKSSPKKSTCMVDAVDMSTPIDSLPDWQVLYYAGDPGAEERPSPEKLFKQVPLAWCKDRLINFHWRERAPRSDVPPNHFAIAATASVQTDAGTFVIRAIADDGLRVLVDDRLVVDHWNAVGDQKDDSAEIALSAGTHKIRVEYYQATGDGMLKIGFGPKP